MILTYIEEEMAKEMNVRGYNRAAIAKKIVDSRLKAQAKSLFDETTKELGYFLKSK